MSARTLLKTLFVALLLLLALPLVAQKGPESELGFHPGKLYDFSDIDSVNLYNGNVMLTVPIGPRKHVSSTLSYQIQLIYNGKVWDHETYEGCAPFGEDIGTCHETLPNRRSNAGLGWRVSFGRLLPPYEPTQRRSTDERNAWVYESPAGDEHGFGPATGDVRLSADASALRLITIPAPATNPEARIYDVEFPSGEVHRFELLRGSYRLTKISDRFGNHVTFRYFWAPDDPWRVDLLQIQDTTITSHLIQFEHAPGLNESVDRGAIVDYIDYQGVGGVAARYDFTYTETAVKYVRHGDKKNTVVPLLETVTQPDDTAFTFKYYSAVFDSEPVEQGGLAEIHLPTGGKTVYHYQHYNLPSKKTCVGFQGLGVAGIKSRTISDGNPANDRTWYYVQTAGAIAPVDYPDKGGDYCCIGIHPSTPVSGPLYWVRTSVLSPHETLANNELIRTRTDHFFDAYSFDFEPEGAVCTSSLPLYPPKPTDPWAVEGRFAFGYPGTVAGPPASVAKGRLDLRPACYAGYDAGCEADQLSTDAQGRRLTTQIYSGCKALGGVDAGNVKKGDGDCTNGTLERSTYTLYEPHPLSEIISIYPHAGSNDIALQLKSSKTVYHEEDDAGCSGDCFVATDNSGDNGVGLYRQVDQTSNLPDAKTKTTRTEYPVWNKADALNKDNVWIHGTYSERWVEEDGQKRRELTCFDDATGFLERRRVLVDSAGPQPSDLLTVYEKTDQGDVKFVKSYGGDKQAVLGDTDHQCGSDLAARGKPWYQVENHYFTPFGYGDYYTGGVVVWSKYYDRDSGSALSFKTVDRTVDFYTGAITEARDSAGRSTVYRYDPLPVRLKSVSPAGGATSSYQFENADAGRGRNAHVIETVNAGGEITTNTYEFDGLGRLIRTSKELPNGKFAVTQATYDHMGRQATVTQPVERDAHPFSDVHGPSTKYRYDAFDRQTSVVGPDGGTTTFDYSGMRKIVRTSSIATPASDNDTAVVVELYSDDGQLQSVEEQSGPDGTSVTTHYKYDVAGQLVEVKTTSEGVTQTRKFEYDGRNLLKKESHPETQNPDTPEEDFTEYSDYDALGHAWKRTLGGTTINYTYDAAERLTEVAGPEGPIKKFEFGTSGSLNGKLFKAVRHNELTDAGNIDVTETYAYDTASGQMSSRTTLVERVAASGARTKLQEFTYFVDYDDYLLPETVTMPKCGISGCSVEGALVAIENKRTAGHLTEVENFAKLTYHPSGMVATVVHDTRQQSTDTYDAQNGLPRPSRITFTGCTNLKPYFLPGATTAKANASCGVQVSWPAAAVCGGSGTVKYHLYRDNVEIASCLTSTSYVDTTAPPGAQYTYTVRAEGPEAPSGTGSCSRGDLSDPRSVTLDYKSCATETTLEIRPVLAHVGAITKFEATLSSANGPLADENLVFNILGRETLVKTGPDGRAVINRRLDVAPETTVWSVAYAGGVLPPKTAEAKLTIVCGFMSYSVHPSFYSLGDEAGDYPVHVNTSSRCSWIPELNGGAFFTVTPGTEQQGESTFDINVPVMTEGERREGSLVVGYHGVTVRQSKECRYDFSPNIAYLPAVSGSTEIDISAPGDCSWTVKTDASWIAFESPATGKGDGRIAFRFSGNTHGTKRLGRLFIDDGPIRETAYINQEGAPPATCPTLEADLSGGYSVSKGQYVSMRLWVTGSPLRYRWFVNNSILRECDDCDAITLAAGDAGYPAAGKTNTYQVEVSNSCGTVYTRQVSFTNIGGSAGCKVPELLDNLLRSNEAPIDRFSPRGGTRVTLDIIARQPVGQSGPLTYQWYRGFAGDRDDDIGNDTEEIEVSPNSTDFYWVEVSNDCGSQISRTARVFVSQPTTSRRRAVGKDMTFDGRTDLLWTNKNDGKVELWEMAGEVYQRTWPLGVAPTKDAAIQTTGDFSGDDRPDIVWRDPVTGKNTAWITSGPRIDDIVPLPERSGAEWTIGGVNDFDGDESHDIVWHNEQTGENEIWFQAGTEHAGTWALPPNPSPSWGMYGSADFNGDKAPDLYFYDKATGDSSIWIMDDAERRQEASRPVSTNGASSLPQIGVQSVSLPNQTDLTLVPALVADMDSDGQPDILWRNTVTGALSVWTLKNGTELDQVRPPFTSRDSSWELGAGGSANNDEAGGPGNPGGSPTALQVTATAASAGSVSVVTATLTAGTAPVAERELVFALSGVEAARLRTDASGVATAVLSAGTLAPGTYPNAIAVSFAGDTAYAASSATADLVINAAAAKVTWNTPAPVVYGTPLSITQLNATADVPGTFVYTPAAGTLLPAGYHTLSVTFTPDDTARAPVTSEVVLLVNKAPSSVSWTAPAAITYGVALSAIQQNATSSLAGEFTYDPAPGTILPPGTHTLKVTFEPADANYAVSTATTTIDVGKGEQIVRWNAPAPMTVGDPLGSAQLNATVIPSGTDPAGAMTYDPPAGTVLPEGTHELTVNVAETASYRAATARVDVIVARQSSTITWANPAPIVYGTALSATQLNATADVPGTFTYTPPAGTILGAGTERLAVLFTPTDSRYLPATATVSIQIGKATPAAAWSAPAPIVYGTPLSDAQLNATASVPGTFVYTPPLDTILDAGTHELTARFVAGDSRNYESVTTKVLLVVKKAPQTIVWPSPAPITYPAPLSATELNATVQVVGPAPGGAVSYTPVAGTVLQAGPGQLLTVNVAGTPNYEPATATVTLDVLKATPVITWATPAPIVYKTRLDATQLNATADVPGSFRYTPAAGTLLDAGLHTLTAGFTPVDTRNYNDASATVTLEVQRADPVLTWTRPAEIVYGTPLSSAQLNATADVPGTFDYTPPAGTILDAGAAQTLSVHFTPDDRRNYNDAGASTTIDVARAPQTIVWANPAAIVYGTALSAAQLNAAVEVPGPAAHGALTYAPAAGTVLDAGPGQTLSVAAAETANYLPASATVTLDVLPAPLSLAADAKSKLYGDPVPVLTGVLTGVVNNDPITATYATTATQQSVTGTYPITGTLVDPANRLANYDVTITPSTLTVHPAPLIVAANAASKQYSDPVPQLTATYTGFVLGETPAVLTGTLSIQSPVERLSAPGTYPIAIGGLSSANYAITYVGATFTVLPEDARVAIISPLEVSAVRSGATTITLSATVQDISATAGAAGDVDAGDILTATLTFVDRATDATLCTATIGLIVSTDERSGVATCSFTRDFGTSLPATVTAGARIGGYYTRDAAADDATLTVSAPTSDSITGGAGADVTSAAGALEPAAGSTARLNLNLQYDKQGSVKGNLTFTFSRTVDGTVRQYELVAAPRSLAIRRTTAGGVATVVGTATVRDVTVRNAPVVVVQAAPLVVTAADAGEPSVDDAYSVALFNPDGGLWLAAGWDGLRAVGQRVREGNITVHYGR